MPGRRASLPGQGSHSFGMNVSCEWYIFQNKYGDHCHIGIQWSNLKTLFLGWLTSEHFVSLKSLPLRLTGALDTGLDNDAEDAADALACELLGEYCSGAPWINIFLDYRSNHWNLLHMMVFSKWMVSWNRWSIWGLFTCHSLLSFRGWDSLQSGKACIYGEPCDQ